MEPRVIIDRARTAAKRVAKAIYRWPLIWAAPVYRKVLLPQTRFIGITGSAGKTTTKDLTYEILRSRFRAHKSFDTNNQLFTVARTMIEIRPGTAYCVQEVGVAGVGSMDRAVRLLAPSIAVVTTVQNEHGSAFPNDDAIAEEKARLVRALLPGGIAVLNADDPRALAMAQYAPGQVVTFGLGHDADVRGAAVEADWPHGIRFEVHYRGEAYSGLAALHGTHLIYCILAAVATGVAAGIEVPQCLDAIRDFRTPLGRMSVHTTRSGIVFVRDDWKAPLWSLAYPIEFMSNIPARRRVLILGTIADYRGSSFSRYRDIVGLALRHVDEVVMVGPHAGKAERIARQMPAGAVRGFLDVKSTREYLAQTLAPGDAVLLKGSHAAQHLSRLALMFDSNVTCWREQCHKEIMCDACALL